MFGAGTSSHGDQGSQEPNKQADSWLHLTQIEGKDKQPTDLLAVRSFVASYAAAWESRARSQVCLGLINQPVCRH